MKDFSYLAHLAQRGATADTKTQLKIAEQMAQLIKSTIAELKVKVKKGG